MMGPYEKELTELVEEKIKNGLTNWHISWGPEAHKLTVEERCKAILDFEKAPRKPVEAWQIDGCRKCAIHYETSDWSQCEGSCPNEISPHYSQECSIKYKGYHRGKPKMNFREFCESLGEPKMKFEDTFSAETVILNKYFPERTE